MDEMAQEAPVEAIAELPPPSRGTRHGRHRRDSRPFTIWMPIHSIARLRRRAMDLGMTVSKLVSRAIGPLDTIVLTEEDCRWVDEQMRKGAERDY